MNNSLTEFIHEYINQRQSDFTYLSDKIWEHPETNFKENFSAELLANALENEGFVVQRGVGNIETAFIASYGSGHPVIALLGEYDALSGLSQKAGCYEPSPVIENGNGHGCGHNLLGTAALAAAFAVKAWLQKNQLLGTVRFYGCQPKKGVPVKHLWSGMVFLMMLMQQLHGILNHSVVYLMFSLWQISKQHFISKGLLHTPPILPT